MVTSHAPRLGLPGPVGLTRALRAPAAVARALPGAGRLARALRDELTHPDRRPRRVWHEDGSAHIELIGAARTGGPAAHAKVCAALRALAGVDWAEVDEGLGRVLVGFDAEQVEVPDLVDSVAEVERALHAQVGPGQGPARVTERHPAETDPLLAETVALATDTVAFGVALAGRFVRLPAVPRAASAVVALVDGQPRLRAALAEQIGPAATDLSLGFAGACLGALTQQPDVLGIAALGRLARIAELRAAARAFHERAPQLTADTAEPDEADDQRPGRRAPGPGTEGHGGAARPLPLPDGPVELATARLAAAGLALGGAGLLVGRSPRLAGELLLATLPRAARAGREIFAATAGRCLAARGIVALDAGCLRRLDRVDTVVVAAPALLGRGVRVLSATDAVTWSRVEALLGGLDPRRAFRPGEIVARDGDDRLVAGHDTGRRRAADPAGLPLLLRLGRGRASTEALAGATLDGHAEAVLRAARGCGRVVLTEHLSVADVAGFADATVPAASASCQGRGPGPARSADGGLAREVRRLQGAGAVVCVVADAEDDDALRAADVGVGLARAGRRPPWSADLLCGTRLTDVWHVLQLPPRAAAASRRAATLSLSGSALAALTTAVGGPASGPSGRRLALVSGPVSAAAATAMAAALVAALRAGRGTPPPPVLHTHWHALSAEATLRRLPPARTAEPAARSAATQPPAGRRGFAAATARRGARNARALASTGQAARAAAAKALGERTGPAAAGARRYLTAIAADLSDPLVPVLLVGAAASAVLGSTTDALLVSAVSLANAAISGAQRARAEALMARLIERTVPMAHVVTAGGDLVTCRADALRPGDVIELGAQDVVPADARLLQARALEIDEATLTGESAPVTKQIEPTPAAELGERACMVYEGSTVLAGTGRAVVVATGEATIAGRAAVVAQTRVAGPVGVQARLGELTRLALPLTGLSGLAVAALGSLRGAAPRSALGSGVAVAVAAVPEGLPLVATVAQVAAARRLARQGVLVRSSRVVEALGRADVVCFDKTGTLTEGRLLLRAVAVPDSAGRWRTVPVPAPGTSAAGGPPQGAAARALAVAAAACPSPEGPVPHATDRAVLDAAAGQPGLLGERADESPFETARGYASTLLRTADGPVLAVKGAPEVLLGLVELDAARLASARAVADRLARAGLRVLAVAESPRGSRPTSAGDLGALRLLGFVGIADPPRPSATPGVRQLLDAGLRVVVVTGDHPQTAAAIAREVGVPGADRVVTGARLDRLSEDGYAAQAGAAAVFARLSPEQKVRLVTTLQRLGKVVVMTGDGTNDAAAIRAADVGVAIRGRGTAAATGAADLLLTDGEVTRIAEAVLAGRRMWRSVTDAVSVLVGGNAGEVAFTLLGTAVAGRAPLRPRQLLLVNLLTDMAPAMALAVRSRDDHAAGPEEGPAEPPRAAALPGTSAAEAAPGAASEADAVAGRWLTGSLRRMLLVRGTTTTAGATAAWLVGRYTGTPRRASTIALLALVATQLGQTLMLAGRDPLVIATALASMLVLAVLVQTPALSALFGCRPVGPVGWNVALTSAVLATSAAWLYERRRRRAHPAPGTAAEGERREDTTAGTPPPLAPLDLVARRATAAGRRSAQVVAQARAMDGSTRVSPRSGRPLPAALASGARSEPRRPPTAPQRPPAQRTPSLR